jgi:hypothetical protein
MRAVPPIVNSGVSQKNGLTDIYTILSVLGSLASLIGILLALIPIFQARNAARRSAAEAKASKEAALQAKDEVKRFRREIRLIYNVIDFEKSLALMDEIKSFIRNSNFVPVPDKIATLIALLNTIRSPSMEIGVEAERKIQECVVALRRIEVGYIGNQFLRKNRSGW